MKLPGYEGIAKRIASAETEADHEVAGALLALYYRAKDETPVRERLVQLKAALSTPMADGQDSA